MSLGPIASLRSTIIYQTTGSTISTGSVYVAGTSNVPVWTNQLTYSTLTGSTLSATTVSATTVTASAVGYSTLIGSTLSSNTMSVGSTLTGSTMTLSGNVGIGTTNPQSLLQVTNSTISTSYNTPTFMVSDGAADAGTTYGMINLTRPLNVTDNKGHIAFIRSTSAVQLIGYLQNSNTCAWVASNTMNTAYGIFMTGTGNVGIGISNPYNSMHVHNGNIRVTSGGNSFGLGGLVEFGVATLPSYSPMANIGGYLENSYTAGTQLQGGLQFNVTPINGGAATTTFTAMIIRGSGNVGIGTTNPQNTLSVYNTTANNQSPPDGNSTSGQIVIQCGKTGITPYSMSIGVDQTLGIAYLNAAGNAAYQPICLQSRGGGNVGIGTTNPAYTLDVNGPIRTIGGIFSCTYTSAFNVTSISISPTNFSPNASGWYIAFTHPNSVAAGSSLALVFCTSSGFYVAQSFSGPHTYGLTGGALNTPLVISGLFGRSDINYGVTLIQLRNVV